ncbi:TPA: AAA family ATPase, partial [Enterococcus faecalis]|nr:AAA family ATPase [Enterococcus faecalis]
MLRVNKLIVQGIEYQRTLRFTEGLNIISGEKTSGKSLILSLIDYCLGKSSSISLRVQNELADHVDTIFLEITIRNDVFTVSRDIKKNKSIFW